MAGGGGPPASSKLLSQAQGLQITGLPQAKPQGYPARAALPKAQPATAIRPYRTGLTSRQRGMGTSVPKIPTIRWK